MNRDSPKILVVAIAACFLGVILALVGAELPSDATFGEALLFWLTITCTAAFLLTAIDITMTRLAIDVGVAMPLKTVLIGAATIFLVTLPIALMCLSIEGLLPDSDSMFATPSAVDSTPLLVWVWADQYLNLLPAMAGFWLLIKVLDLAFSMVSDMQIQPHKIETTSSGGATDQAVQRGQGVSALVRRFPEISGQELLAVEADEHYVRLHTDVGSKHVLYRFRDALKDVEDLSGLRVHRSWWVAEDAIEAFDQSASGFGLKLRGGLRAPVSQTYRRDVEKMIGARSRSN
ncbi:MAG: LytTR family DNA-binding domain-containing protein [Pseudomonadota bacterium]